MDRLFDADYWERHHREAPEPTASTPDDPNPHLVEHVAPLRAGRALDAGCGRGVETAWLAAQGWRVLGVDVSRTALARADRMLRARGLREPVELVAADLTTWAPSDPPDLVVTHYAHPPTPQLEFHRRLAGWVAPGGTLLIVGHLHRDEDAAHAEEPAQDHVHEPAQDHTHDHEGPPPESQVRAADVVALLDPQLWRIEAAEESTRRARTDDGTEVTLHDVVVCATRAH